MRRGRQTAGSGVGCAVAVGLAGAALAAGFAWLLWYGPGWIIRDVWPQLTPAERATVNSGWLALGCTLAGVILGGLLTTIGNVWMERRRFQREELHRINVRAEDAARALLDWCLEAAEQAIWGQLGRLTSTGQRDRKRDQAKAAERLQELTRLIAIRVHDLADAEVRKAAGQYTDVLENARIVVEARDSDLPRTSYEVIWQAKEIIVRVLGAVIRQEPIPTTDPLPRMWAAVNSYFTFIEQQAEAQWRERAGKAEDS